MTITIAVAGKGGTGKTTFTALLLRQLVKQQSSVLAVDADPNANLNEALGLEVDMRISDVLEDTKDPKAVPIGMTKEVFVEYKLQQCLVETKYVDLLVMGNPQGPGCYCYANDLLRKYLESMVKGYDFMVIDSEAGLEHLSRKTIPQLDYLFVISDSSARGVRSAGRVNDIVKTLKTPVKNIGLIVTRTKGELGALQGEIDKTQLQLLGTIPYSDQLVQYDLEGRALFELPDDNEAVIAIEQLVNKIGLK